MKIGVIADIHEDIAALKEAFKLLEKEAVDEVVCLGDITGYKVHCCDYLDTRSAHECIAMVRANCSAVVVGNHDLYTMRRLPRFDGGFDFPSDWFELDFFEKKAISNDRIWLYDDVVLQALLTREDRSYLESLPEFAIQKYDEQTILFSHFAYPDLHGVKMYFPKMAVEFRPHLDFISLQGATMGLSGHMHFEGVSFVTEGRIQRNPFGKYPLKEELQWIYGPCVARGQFLNGVLLLDTQAGTVRSMRIADVSNGMC